MAAIMTTTTTTTTPASLYVGDLHYDVNDSLLFEAFNEFKSLSSVRVCRDSTSGRSLGYGYVNFLSQHDAIQAIDKKNHSVLLGKVMRVTWSHRDPDARKSGIGNVFVKNLTESIDNMGLQELFSNYGTIVSCKVATFEDGKSKGYGFVQFETEEAANSAIEKLNGSTIGDKQICVCKFVKRSDRVLSSPDVKYTNLFVKNLDLSITEEMLEEKFSEFGKIASLVIVKDESRTSKGYGFVNFDHSADARRAMEATNGSQLGSKVIYVGRAQKKAEREQVLRNQFEEKRREQILKYKGSNVYVKNIDDDVTDEEFKEHFSQCGKITSSKLMRDDKGISKGFGFVCFSSPEEANKAVATFHGHMFHRKPLYVAIAQRKEERHAQLQLQYAHHFAGIPGPSTAVMPGGYPPLYYAAPPGIVSQVPPRPGVMYQPLGMRPEWRGNGFASVTRPTFKPQFPAIPNGHRLNRQGRGRINGHMHPQSSGHAVSCMQHSTQSLNSSDDPSNQRSGQAKYVRNGRARDMNKGSAVPSAGLNSVGSGHQGSDMLSSMLAAASPDEQKQILGERLYPLVHKLKPDLVTKITGMLLEMDNAELLLLLESPESLTAKVEEAVQVLKISKTKVSGQENIPPSFFSAEVAVN